jgi:murein DD-endopeptidase MepM/ murein hydrolase activator NlpD
LRSSQRLGRAGAAAGLALGVLLAAAAPASASLVSDNLRAEKRVGRQLERVTQRSRVELRLLRRAVRGAQRDNETRPGFQTLSALHEAERAERSYERWTRMRLIRLRERREELSAWLSTWAVFPVCPVDPPRYIHDDFGEIVTVGDTPPHVHMGSDVEAPYWTPIRAPFDGYAWGSSSPLGGYQVRVRGDRGYVFIAHLIGYGNLGWVDAGTTVGYVGSTGLSTAPHAHVEWHPWDGGAVDPYYFLRLSCG